MTVTFNQQGTTPSNDPIIRAKVDSVDSKADFVVPSDNNEIHVWYVKPNGEIPQLLSAIVQEYGRTSFVFKTALTESGTGNIRDHLDNFNETTVETSNGKVTTITTDWML